MPVFNSMRFILAVTLVVAAIPACSFSSIPAQFHEGMRPDEVQYTHHMTLAEYEAKVADLRSHTVLEKRGGGTGPTLDSVYANLPSGFVAQETVDFLAAALNPNHRPKRRDYPGNVKYLPILARQGTVLHAMVLGSDITREARPGTCADCTRLTETLEEVVVSMDIGSLIPAAEIDRYRFTLWPQPNSAAAVYVVPLDDEGQVDKSATAFIFTLYKMQGTGIKQATRIEWKD